MNNYQKQKENARHLAQCSQVYEFAMSWGELFEQGQRLEKLAKRYGLIKEFRNEGII